MKNKQGGFLSAIAIALIAVLAVGGGVYAVKKSKEKQMHEGDNVETRADGRADEHANVRANLGAGGVMKGSLRSLFGIGKDTECTIENTMQNYSSKGTVYVTSKGEASGNFTSTVNGRAIDSHMIIKDGVTYTWSGTQGSKISLKDMPMPEENGAKIPPQDMQKNGVDMNSQVNYSCKDWAYDASKFVIPTTVQFVDLGEMMKKFNINASGNLNLNAGANVNTHSVLPTR